MSRGILPLSALPILWACDPDAQVTLASEPPTVEISRPGDGDTFSEYEPVWFEAKVGDEESEPSELLFIWSAGALGVLEGNTTAEGNLAQFSVGGGFPAGQWPITLLVVDPDGESAEATVSIGVLENQVPTVEFSAPAVGAAFPLGAEVSVSVTVADADLPSLSDLNLIWGGSDGDNGPANPDAAGVASFSLVGLAAGEHQITVTVADPEGATAFSQVSFLVLDPDPDVDGDGSPASLDCDDLDETAYPGAPETCDGVDDDCDAEIDEEAVDQPTWFEDADGDGFGSDTAVVACERPPGFAAVAGDCNDGNPRYYPGADESDCADAEDYNCDGSVAYTDADGDGYPACEDCNDNDFAVNTNATEVCNEGIDDDCDGLADDADSDVNDPSLWYVDADGDHYGESGFTLSACAQPAGYAALDGDCNDGWDAVYPTAPEPDCTDPVDYDCDGQVAYADADGDGFARCEDCDDDDPRRFPGNPEVCNFIDDDCNGLDDDSDPGLLESKVYFEDVDGDGYGSENTLIAGCEVPTGYAALAGDCDDADAAYNPGKAEPDCTDTTDYNCDGEVPAIDNDADGWFECEDCDDTNPDVNPDAIEVCNGIDDNCDDERDEKDIDDVLDAEWYYGDDDNDGFGDAMVAEFSCKQPGGFVLTGDDCNDRSRAVYPGAIEVCGNGEDDDCAGGDAVCSSE